ncbi:unnamed protein product [Rangifer tarandus platyrhynchus]|uniref:Uncharacterized protein n=1 Tax=Rangifer tarandus platyrhynchus TaxID=3082113 RepID=A0AC59ZGA3_RANTA
MPTSLVWELAALAPPSQQQPPVCKAPRLPPPGGKCTVVSWATLSTPAQDLSPRPQLLTLHGGPGCCADTPVAGVSAPPAAALAPSQQQGKGPIAQDPVRASVTGTRNGSGGKAQSL